MNRTSLVLTLVFLLTFFSLGQLMAQLGQVQPLAVNSQDQGPTVVDSVSASNKDAARVSLDRNGEAMCRAWKWHNPLPQGSTLMDVIQADATTVAVGGGGMVVSSIDGMNWTEAYTGAGRSLRSVAWNGLVLVAVGFDSYEDVVLTSSDAQSWTRQDGGSAVRLIGVTSNGSDFVAISTYPRTAYKSSNGIVWNAFSTGSPYNIYEVVWVGSQYVVVGNVGVIMTSPDGESWTLRNSPTTNDLWGLAASPSVIVAVGDSGTILSSPDGVDWVERSSPVSAGLRSVTWTGTQFVAMGIYGEIVTSIDGVAWVSPTTIPGRYWYGLAWTGGELIAAGSGGAILASADSAAWTSRSPTGHSFTSRAVAANTSASVAVTTEGFALRSTNAADWSQHQVSSQWLTDVIWDDNRWVAVGRDGAYTSSDVLDWTEHPFGTSISPRAISTNGSLYVIVGAGGAVDTSPDLDVWTAQTSETSNNLKDITWGDGQFLAVGYDWSSFSFSAIHSPDGVSWQSVTPSIDCDAEAVVWNGTSFIAVGMRQMNFDGCIVTSPDGENWTPGPTGMGQGEYFDVMTNGSDTWVVGRGSILKSANGIDWTEVPASTDGIQYGSVWFKGRLVVVGDDGAVLSGLCDGPIFQDGFESGSTGAW